METFIEEFKIIFSYLKKYKKRVQIASFFALIGVGISVAIPFLYGRLVDLVQVFPTDLWLIFNLLAIWLLMSLISAFLNKKSAQIGSFVGIDASNDLICRASAHLINLPLSFHKKKKAGEIISKIDRAANYLFRIFDEILIWSLPQFLAAILGILVLFFIEWRLALGATIVFSVYILVTLLKTIPIIKNQEELNKVFEEVHGNLYDASLNVQTVKSCAAEKFQIRKTSYDYRNKLAPIFKDFNSLWNSLSFWQNFIFSIGFIALFGLALYFLKQEILTAGQLIMFLGYLNLIHAPLRALAWQWQTLKTGMTAIKRVEEFLKIEAEDFKKEGIVLKKIQGNVEFKNISFGYQADNLILDNINLKVLAGQKIALVGGSGQGKTTLIDLISLYFQPISGEILIDGVNIQSLNLNFLRKIIAYIPQEITLFNDTVRNNIRYGKIEATEEEIVKAAKAAHAHEFVESFSKKYEQIVGERGVKLSTGQKQRIAIARALIRDPKILILDEATSSLDSESEKLIQEALGELIKEKTTFIIAHRLSTVKKADKILVLEKGKIIEEGTHEELIKIKGAYFKFYSLQFDQIYEKDSQN